MKQIILLLLVSVIVPCSYFFANGQSRSYAVIVGMKFIDDSSYAKNYDVEYDGEATAGSEMDVQQLKTILNTQNIDCIVLTNKNARRKVILDTIASVGKKVKENDQFIFYFSGHGDRVVDDSKDEKSGYDQVLVAYDDFIIDDEIYVLLNTHFKKTKNVMIIDACHSSTTWKMAKPLLDFKVIPKKKPAFLSEAIAKTQSDLLGDCRLDSFPKIVESFNLVYIGATTDEGLAKGYPNGGLLTTLLANVIKTAKSVGTWKTFTYRKLACEIDKKMRFYDQLIQYHEIGASVQNYSTNLPFKTN